MVKWYEAPDLRTWEQVVPFGPLTAVYDPDGQVISRPYTREWHQIDGPLKEIPVDAACVPPSGASR